MKIAAVAVFCGSQAGARPEYAEAARALARMLAQRGVKIVFGGGHVGLMGALADEAMAHGAHVRGVIPRHLMRPELAHRGLTELSVVGTMHERKRAMADASDAFIVLPGGYGTMEEMFEMVTWLQLRLQPKPVGVLNIEGYFDALLGFLRHAAAEGFIRAADWDLLIVDHTPELLFDRLELHADRVRRAHPPSGTTDRG
jgi:uncharacterized protein (TIGR00730 family)